MRWLSGITLLLLGGCDRLFSLLEVSGDAGTSDGLVVQDAFDARVVECPADYDIAIASQSGSRYKREDSINDWNSAVGRCAQDRPGATHLAVIGSATELADLAPYFDRTRFIGMSDKVADGTYRAVTDEVVSYPALYMPNGAPWQAGEPDNSGDCVSLDTNRQAEDQDCTGASVDLAWLCECDGYPDDPTNYTP